MVVKTGISVPEDLHSEIMDAKPEEMSKSEWMSQLMADGLAAQQALAEVETDIPSEIERKHTVRQFLLDGARAYADDAEP